MEKIANGQLKNSYGQAIEKISHETQTMKMYHNYFIISLFYFYLY